MRVYHGTTTWKMASLFDDDFSKRLFGLYVTDTWERAARYANSQAGQEVTTRTLPLSSCAVVVSIEVEEPIQWSQRSNPASLDQKPIEGKQSSWIVLVYLVVGELAALS